MEQLPAGGNENWVESVMRRIEESGEYRQWDSGQNPTIFRVPTNMRSGDPSAYEPKMVSIGPYHRGKPQLMAMEKLKWQFLHDNISTSGSNSRRSNNIIGEYLRLMKGLEEKTRRCYSEEIKLGSNEFVEMMLLDAFFLLNIVLLEEPGIRPLEQLRHTMWFHHQMVHDLLMLENQLPYITVLPLLAKLKPEFQIPSDPYTITRQGELHLKVVVLTYFLRKTSWANISQQNFHDPLRGLQSLEVHHFLHLFHSWFFRTPNSNSPELQNSTHDQTPAARSSSRIVQVNNIMQHQSHSVSVFKSIPCATELVEAGVKLKTRSTNTFWDVSFRKGVLGIPTVYIDDSMNSVFRNLIAFEQCCPKFGSVVTAYSVFMDFLINSPEDAVMLQRKGLIENGLGDHKEVASLFSRIAKSISYDHGNSYLKNSLEEINSYCGTRWHKWRAKLVHDYFSSPWAIISVITAIVVLLISFVQFGFSIRRSLHGH